ncbi:DUF1905 domain-containing protein [Sphingobacterium psychroaquaticum]|uniref:YdeI/OmpD-associated family protein n=1 Tax=Sphingobacterium psychroaquaticum TaxID=561061 RepID=UPI00106A5F80|nr:YdeI/OmpD-associated family protein [Sphingobacterium psychroaquaticum]QBQ41352.1 DUF1905 domain-containing protein [Sphingobacterium psychroaquaticum]
MIKDKPLVDKAFVLEKEMNKCGWTYVRLPELAPSKNTAFGWLRVSGTIEGHEIKKYNLQSMGNGVLFLPVNAQVRKKIKKQIGDLVHITLYEDKIPSQIQEELELCLRDIPQAYTCFLGYSEREKREILEWIYLAKTEEVKLKRMVQAIDKITQSAIA